MNNLLILALNNEKILDYFRGSNGYRMFSYNGDPNNAFMQDYSGVVWSFHTLNKEKPELNLPVVFSDNLNTLLDSSDLYDIYTSLQLLDAQIFAESNKFSSFKIDDMDQLLLKLKTKLLKHKDELSKISFKGEQMSVWDLANKYNQVNVSTGKRSFL